MFAVVGLVILMGVQSFPEIKRDWDTSVMYDVRNVRECMERNILIPIYCRFFCMTSKRTAKRGDEEYVRSPPDKMSGDGRV